MPGPAPIAVLPLLLAGCGPSAEPLDLPADPAATGVPVGVRAAAVDGLAVEILYPAPDAAAEDPTEVLDLSAFVPAAVLDALGDVDLPILPVPAVRDADLRLPEAPYPVLLFSHGFGGFPLQSATLTAHLASRGYVVVAPEHPGRRLADLLPCLFSPPLDGCEIAFEDPAEEDLPAVLDAVDGWAAAEDGFLGGSLDTGLIGLFGHSAGGNSTASVGTAEARFGALVPMAADAATGREVPTLYAGGTCDGTVVFSGTEAAWSASPGARLLALEAAGHLAFSDLCALDLGAFAQAHLAGREDVHSTLLQALEALATDGCPGYAPPEGCGAGAFLGQDDADAILRHYVTVHFDEALLGMGPGLEDGVHPAATLR